MSKVIQRLEEKYGITVVPDIIYNPFNGKVVNRYKMYSADGCPWENGLTIRGIQDECKKWGETLLNIKELVTEKRS